MKRRCMALAMVLASAFLFGESFAFVGRDISDILFALSEYKGFPVVADDTVSGTADFRCSGEDFDVAFESFLRQNRLYVQKADDGWTVSKIKLERRYGEFSLDAYDVTAAQMFERVGIETGVCVVAENLPQMHLSLHTGFCEAQELVRRVAALCAGWEVVKEQSGFFRLVRQSGQTIGAGQTAGRAEFTERDGMFFCDVVNAQLGFAVEKLCALSGEPFCIVSGGDGKIARAEFGEKSFADMLELLCLQGGAETALVDGVRYVFASKTAKDTLASAGKAWQWQQLRYLRTNEFLSLAAKRFPQLETIAVHEQGAFLYRCDQKTADDLATFVAAVDTAQPMQVVQLQYLRTSDFFAHLPPFVEKSQVVDSGHGDRFYFTGSAEAYARLLSALPAFDKPVTRITYDVLIMQYQHTDGSEWTPSFRIDRLKLGDVNAASAQLGSVLDFNLDVVGAFGLKFAADLQAAITSAKAQVFADTTLNGVSGSTISFQNTNTYRYRDNNLDPDTGKPIYSGITKEIISGLKLEVTGTVTGDGMITSKITASVSRQGADVSSTTGNPPPTSEKVITTEVRAKSGEPVVLSGLIQNEQTETTSRTPFLSRIPLLGWLFKAKQTAAERTELVIYLLPSAELTEQKPEADVHAEEVQTMARLFKEFVK